jgi:16S rRNA U1498 N3-methylase RsmE
MRLNRFYLENFSKSKTLELKDNLIIHQIKNVLRLKIVNKFLVL